MEVLDLETTGTNHHLDSITGIGLTSQFYPNPSSEFLENLLVKEYPYIIFNANFDLKFLLNERIVLDNIRDPMIMAFLLKYPTLSLQELAKEVGYTLTKWSPEFNNKQLEEHCLRQLEATEALYIHYDKDLKEEGLEEVAKLENNLLSITAQMEHKGVRLDLEGLKIEQIKLTKELTSLEQELYNIVGKTFNLRSPHQLGEVLFKDLGLQPLEYSKGGKEGKSIPSTSEQALKPYINHPFVSRLLKKKKIEKLLNTFINPRIKENKDIIYTHFNQIGTPTGRYSSYDPNLQNFPESIRVFFIPREGHKFVIMDYNQIELRWLAILSGCKQLLEDFKNNKDIHKATAKLVGSNDRKLGKTLNFATLYGQSPFTLSKKLDNTFEEAFALTFRYFSQYPEIKEYQNKLHRQWDTGFIRTPFGRKFYYGVDLQDNKQINNWPIQSSAADTIKTKMYEIYKMSDKAPILQLHDELVYEIPNKDVDEFYNLLTKITTYYYQEMDFPAEIVVKDKWEK